MPRSTAATGLTFRQTQPAFAIGAQGNGTHRSRKWARSTFVYFPHPNVRGAECQLGVADGLWVAGADGLQALLGSATWQWGGRRGRTKQPGQALAKGRAVRQLLRSCAALCGTQQRDGQEVSKTRTTDCCPTRLDLIEQQDHLFSQRVHLCTS